MAKYRYRVEEAKKTSRKPVDFLNEKIQIKETERTRWEEGRRKKGDTYSQQFEKLSDAWTKKYVRGSLIMLISGFVMLIELLSNIEQLIPSEYAVIPLHYQLCLVAVVLILAFWDLLPYRTKTLTEQKGYAVVCRMVYWLGVALVVFSFAQGDEMRSVLKALAMLFGCIIVLLVNNRQRRYVPARKKGGKVLLSLARILVLICQCVVTLSDYLVRYITN